MTNVYSAPTYIPVVFNFTHPSIHSEITYCWTPIYGPSTVFGTKCMRRSSEHEKWIIWLVIHTLFTHLVIHPLTHSIDGYLLKPYCLPGTVWGTRTDILLFSAFFLIHCSTHIPPPALLSTEAKPNPTIWGLLHVHICVCGYFRGRGEWASGGRAAVLS